MANFFMIAGQPFMLQENEADKIPLVWGMAFPTEDQDFEPTKEYSSWSVSS